MASRAFLPCALLLTLLNAVPALAAPVSKEARQFADAYLRMLDSCRTEVEFTVESERLAKKAGFRDLNALPKDVKLQPGDRVYIRNHDRAIILAVIGNAPVADGINLLAGHTDSPRLDLKAHPVFTSEGFYQLQTYAFGGIKRYQWVNIPLQLHCNWVDAAGVSHHVIIGDDPGEPILLIPDIEPHLGRDYAGRTSGDVIGAEETDPIIGMVTRKSPAWNAKDQPATALPEVPEDELLGMLAPLLANKTITVTDLVTGQFHLTPSMPSRYVGFDESMLAGYGHDDRANSYPALRALLELSAPPPRTAMAYLVGQEEVGSINNTGAASTFLNSVIARLLEADPRTAGSFGDNLLRSTLQRSWVLSADTPPAVNPIFPGVWESGNAIRLGDGPAVLKWGAGRDPNPAFFAALAASWNNAGLAWQAAPLGRNGAGGGGTIGGFMSQEGMEVIDVGVPVLSLHAPYEVISVEDLYAGYQLFTQFVRQVTPPDTLD